MRLQLSEGPVTADHCLARPIPGLSDCLAALSGLRAGGGFTRASGGPFPPHLGVLVPQYAPLTGDGFAWGGGWKEDHVVGWGGVQGCMRLGGGVWSRARIW